MNRTPKRTFILPISQKTHVANEQPQNPKQLIINTLTPKTMGTHGNPPVAIPHRPQKE